MEDRLRRLKQDLSGEELAEAFRNAWHGNVVDQGHYDRYWK